MYVSAASTFAELIRRVPADRWDGPGLGEWSLRDLAGHTVSSALRQVPEVLATAEQAVVPADGLGTARADLPPIGVDSPEAYWALPRSVPAEVLAAAVADDDVVHTQVGCMRVDVWLPTRTFELVVHGLDVAAASGVPVDFAPPALAETAALAARVAVVVGDGPLVLRALTGRATLPPGFLIL